MTEMNSTQGRSIYSVLDRIENQRPMTNPTRLQSENVEIGPNDLSIDLLRAVYRANHLPLHTRMRAAMACLKHEVPSLGISVVVNDDDIATRLDRALARIAATNNNANNHANGAEVITEPTIEPEPRPSPPLPAPLNRLYNKKLYRRI
jgi:hypothetical protein